MDQLGLSDQKLKEENKGQNQNEMSTLKTKLESKSKALVILSQDLVEVKRERDEYKLMAEQIRDRYKDLKRKVSNLKPTLSNGYEDYSHHHHHPSHHHHHHQQAASSGSFSPSTPLGTVLIELTEQNKFLLFEVEDLKTKLIDAEGDLKLLREELKTTRAGSSFSKYGHHNHHHQTHHVHYDDDPYDRRSFSADADPFGRGAISPVRPLEDVVAQLEMFRNRVRLMEADLEAILDEKEELILSRDSYKRKVERLNEKLNYVIRKNQALAQRLTQIIPDAPNDATAPDDHHHSHEMMRGASGLSAKTPEVEPESITKILDIDSIVTENLYLKEKLTQLDDEKNILNKTLVKYRNLLHQDRTSATVTPSSSGIGSGTASKRNILDSLRLNYGSSTKLLSDNSPPDDSLITSIDYTTTSGIVSSKQLAEFISSNDLNNLDISGPTVSRLRSLVVGLFEALCDKSTALSLHKKNNKLLGRRIQELEDKIKELKATEKVMLLTQHDVVDPHHHHDPITDPDPSILSIPHHNDLMIPPELEFRSDINEIQKMPSDPALSSSTGSEADDADEKSSPDEDQMMKIPEPLQLNHYSSIINPHIN